MAKKILIGKIGSLDALKSFREKGHIYANTLAYFSKLEDDPNRADSFETMDTFHDPKGWQIKYTPSKDGGVVTLDESNIKLLATGTLRYDLLNVYCMYAISLDNYPSIPSIDERVLGFGSHCVLVLDLAAFLERIKRYCQEHKIGLEGNVVEYFDENTYRGRRSPFQKPLYFTYQSEYRLVFTPPRPEDSLELFLGDITDITTPVSNSVDLLGIKIVMPSS